jgi:hypothetical protein
MMMMMMMMMMMRKWYDDDDDDVPSSSSRSEAESSYPTRLIPARARIISYSVRQNGTGVLFSSYSVARPALTSLNHYMKHTYPTTCERAEVEKGQQGREVGKQGGKTKRGERKGMVKGIRVLRACVWMFRATDSCFDETIWYM